MPLHTLFKSFASLTECFTDRNAHEIAIGQSLLHKNITVFPRCALVIEYRCITSVIYACAVQTL